MYLFWDWNRSLGQASKERKNMLHVVFSPGGKSAWERGVESWCCTSALRDAHSCSVPCCSRALFQPSWKMLVAKPTDAWAWFREDWKCSGQTGAAAALHHLCSEQFTVWGLLPRSCASLQGREPDGHGGAWRQEAYLEGQLHWSYGERSGTQHPVPWVQMVS